MADQQNAPDQNTSDDELDEIEDTNVPQIIAEEIDNLYNNENSPFRRKAEEYKFPLSKEDKVNLVKLYTRFESEPYISGLSAPQLGINKRAFIFQVREGEGDQPFQTSLWLNPVYKTDEGTTLDEDYEVCYSLESKKQLVVGPVFRLNRIFYRAYETDGRIVEGEAHGFTARVIQHEIDHLDGRLFIDFVEPERLIPLPEYVTRLEEGTLDKMQEGVVPQTCQ